MNKIVKIGLGAVLGLGIFTVGVLSKDILTQATGDWKTTVINDASAELGSSGYTKKEELKASAVTDINAKVESEISDDIETQKVELQTMLDDYYRLKLEGMTQTQSFKGLEIQIKAIQQSIYDRYTKELDAVFAAQQ